MEIPNLNNVMLTPGEAKFIQEWTGVSYPSVAEKVRAARLAFAEKYPPSTEAEIDGIGFVASFIADFESVSDSSVDEEKKRKLFEEQGLDVAAEAAKDEAGVERHLVGPLELSADELQIFLQTAKRIGRMAAQDVVQYQGEIDRKAGGWEVSREMLLPESLQRLATASSIQNAIQAYQASGNPG